MRRRPRRPTSQARSRANADDVDEASVRALDRYADADGEYRIAGEFGLKRVVG